MNFNGDRLAWFGGLGDDCAPGLFRSRAFRPTPPVFRIISPRLSLDIADAGVRGDFIASIL